MNMLGLLLKWLRKPETPYERKKRKKREDQKFARKEVLFVRVRLWRMWQAIFEKMRRRAKKEKEEEKQKRLEVYLVLMKKVREAFFAIALDLLDKLYNSKRDEKWISEKLQPKKSKSRIKPKSKSQAKNKSVEVDCETPELVKKRPRLWLLDIPIIDVNSEEYKKEKAELEKLKKIARFAAESDLSPIEANPDLGLNLAKILGRCVCLQKPCVCGGEGEDDGTSNNKNELNPKKLKRKNKDNDDDLKPF